MQRLPSPSDYGRAAVFSHPMTPAMITGTDLRVDAGAIARYWAVGAAGQIATGAWPSTAEKNHGKFRQKLSSWMTRTAGLFRVNRRAFTDRECLEQERRAIFDKCWIYVGHESEVPHAGDYRSRNVAGRPMILVRGDDSVVRVLLNTCTHRGAMVCRQKSGNAKTFQCPYHAWTYNSRGNSVVSRARIL